MRIIVLVRKTLLELWREPSLLAMILVTPVFLMVIMHAAYGTGSGGVSDMLRVMVVNNDLGSEGRNLGRVLVERMREATFDGKPLCKLTEVTDHSRAELAVIEGRSSLVVAIPHDFSRDLQSGDQSPVVTFAGVESSDAFAMGAAFLEDLVIDVGRTHGRGATLLKVHNPVRYDFIDGTGTLKDADSTVPGVVVFGILFLILSTASLVVRDRVRGTMVRLQLSRVTTLELFSGLTLAQVLLACVQVPLTFAVAYALGHRIAGSLAAAVLIGVLLSLAAVGLGLIVGTVVRSESEAAAVAPGVLVPMALVSGGMFPLPEVGIFQVGGRTLRVWDVLPSAHATEALRRVVILGEGLGGVVFELVALLMLSLLVFATGVILYARLRLRPAGAQASAATREGVSHA